ncbi:MAG TPA: hypothetical protein VHE99_02930 [Gammaproteobacteria bacterium]|nr:hypothetical protein [Gammaproteobacteria bacterium]HVY53382.1 hypothetical protein [Gammaproteobacteria bacterium]
MRYQDQAKSLFQLQTELADSKVEIAVSKAVSQVVDQIINLRHEVGGLRVEMHREISGLRHDMVERFSKVESRLSSVETALGRRDQIRGEIRTRLFDYSFKAGWIIGFVALSAAISSLIVLVHSPLVH